MWKRRSRLSPALSLGLLSAVLWWASLPPAGLWPLAWLAPLPLMALVRAPSIAGEPSRLAEASHPQRPVRSGFRALWLAGYLFWLSALYWMTLPYWATGFGWLALCAYLALYWPLFVGLARVAVHRMRISIVVAAPLAWIGAEWLQAHLLGGFNMAALAHSQYRWLELIQICDRLGAIGLGGLMALVAACVVRALPERRLGALTGGSEAGPSVDGRSAGDGSKSRWTLWPLATAASAIGAVLVYGHRELARDCQRPGPKLALIQGSIDTEIKFDPHEQQRVVQEYVGLSRQAREQHQQIDLMIWPETMFRSRWFTFAPECRFPPEARYSPTELVEFSRSEVRRLAESLGTPLLIGVEAEHRRSLDDVDATNTALFVRADGEVIGRYDKCHPVMFGEYLPLGDWLPWLYSLSPLGRGLKPGPGPVAVAIGGVRYAPSICYESTVAHLVCDHLRTLYAAEEGPPDVLVNLTNDGWFWGSSELDLHLICGVFRAVECRRPLAIAANTGFSAAVSADGRILAQGPRRAAAVVFAELPLDSRYDRQATPFVSYEKWAGRAIACWCAIVAAVGLYDRRRRTAT